jgi:predicted DsbA family dithiol-disulfide isomerase
VRDEAHAFLVSAALVEQVGTAEARAQALGITGVPFFVFDGRVALSGAHEPATMLDAIAQARSAEGRDGDTQDANAGEERDA